MNHSRASASSVEQHAEDAARSRWVERLGRFGFAAKGVLYLVIAAIAGSVGFGSGGSQASQTGAISQLSEQSYGTALLVLLAIGLAGYALLRLVHAFTNPSGEDGGKGVAMRLSYFARFLIYGALTVFTILQLTGGSSSGGGGDSQQLTARALALPAGRLIVAAVASIMFVVAFYQFKNAWTAGFMGQITRAADAQRGVIQIIGRVGFVARGIVFATVGVLLARAALQSDPSEAGGVDKALQTIAQSSAGPAVLTIVALGLACFGLFCLSVAKWGTARTAG